MLSALVRLNTVSALGRMDMSALVRAPILTTLYSNHEQNILANEAAESAFLVN
jgi:hypothetical protein